MAETTFHSITLPGANPARVPLTAVEFNPQTNYKIRDYCTYQGILYRCTAAHSAGTWDSTKNYFTATNSGTNIGDELNNRLIVPPITEPATTDRRTGDLWIDVDTDSPIISVDPQPVAGSTNVPQSGGTFNLIKNLDNNKAGKSLLTGDFSTSSPYSVNDLCIHDGYLYRCIVDIPTGAAWDASKWQATTIETELARIELEEVDLDVIAETFGDSNSYAVGDYVLHTTNGVDKLYRCTSAVSDTSVWNSQYWSEVKLADEVSDLKSALNGIENTEGIIRWGTVGGGVLPPNPASTTATSVGIAREDNILTLSGTSAIGTVRINITFSLFRADSAALLRNSIKTFLPFIKGHKYALRFNYISGSDTDDKPVYIIVRTAEHTDINSVSYEDGEIYKEITWDYDGDGYVFLYVPNASGVTFNDYKFSFTIIDLTTSQKPLYDYIDTVKDHAEAKESFIGSFPPSYVIVDKKTDVDGTLSADNGNCTSRVISFADYVKVIAPDGINVSAVDCTNQLNLSGNPLIIPPNVDVAFNFNKSNGVFNRADFDSITFKSSKSCWNIFNNDFIHHVSASSRIEAWNTEPANYERSFGYNRLETGDRWGFIVSTGNANNSISKLLIADIDLLLISSEEMTLIVNDVLVVVPKATFYSIKKGDAFVVSSSMRIRNTLILSDINSSLYYEIGNQNVGSSLGVQCDSVFLLNEKLVMISKNTGGFNVVKDNEIVQTGSIGNSVGHANSCNYIPESGMLYVSTWDDGKTIACYKITDGDSVSIEFVKNIVINNADAVACEYFVADKEEKVIIGLGWKYPYNKPTNESQNALEVSIYTKINGVYEITKRFLTFAPGELQGMTFNKKNNCIYYLAGAASDYHHTSINVISLDGYSYVALPGIGSILNLETEAIVQITNSNNYLVVANNGARYICGIAD